MSEKSPATPAAPPPPRSTHGRWIGAGLAALLGAGSLGLAWLMQPAPAAPAAPVDSVGAGGQLSAPPSPAAGSARLNVITIPSGAVVIVDDRIVGTSPLTDIALTPGSHAVRCELEGYAPAIAQADTARRTDLQLTLRPVAYAELAVESDPAGAEVLIDGQFRGRTPTVVAKLAPGPHEVVIQKENYSTYQATQVLHAGERKKLADVVLDNKLLAMLQALCAAEPRLISNHLDLAHFYYVNNRMDEAALEFARAIELSKLPMPALPDDATEAERQQVKLNYEWDIKRVRTELDKHTRKYKSYFGNSLDFETFLKQYKQHTSRRWDLSDDDWVAGEADVQIAVGNAQRATELFGDVLNRDAGCVAAACGLAQAYFSAGNPHEGLAQLALAAKAAGVDPKELKGADKKYFARTLRWLASAELQAARQAAPADRDGWRRRAAEHIAAAQKMGADAGDQADDYEAAQLLRLQAHLARETGADPLPKLQAALAAAEKAAKGDKDRDHQTRNVTLVEQLQAETATALTQGGQGEAAWKIWRQLAQEGDSERPFKRQAQFMLDVAKGVAEFTR